MADTGLLYGTDFENFTEGLDQWSGQDGWVANSLGFSVHGIDTNQLMGEEGKTAFLGFSQPEEDFVRVLRPIPHNPQTEGSVAIEFSTVIGIQDSRNGRRDSFFVSFYNSSDVLLASIRFNNQESSIFGIWREDGVSAVDTDFDFFRNSLIFLRGRIDVLNNTWTVCYNGVPIFVDAPFTAVSTPSIELGSYSYEWLLSSADPKEHGDNWMLVVDCGILAEPPGRRVIAVENLKILPTRSASIRFLAEPGWTYFVENSINLTTWNSDPMTCVFSGYQEETSVEYVDESDAQNDSRFYRIRREVTR